MIDKSTIFYKANSIYKMDDGILCFKVKQDDVFDLEDLKAILDLFEEANDGNPFLLLMDIGKFDLLLTKAARTLFNENEKAHRLIIAEAIVFESMSNRILYNLLLRLNSPKFPFKAFNSVEKAKAWLFQQG